MEAGGRYPSRPATEEAARRNTDCVYFLASPLTCKKGNECEYRHSEGARINPRDCWFWLNGNCLNPKCSFRHPPLDGLFASPNATPSGSNLPSTQTAISTQVPAAHAPATHTSNKQSIPCYYFQKGGCLKGERCPFMHGMEPSDSPVTQQTTDIATSVTETSNSLKSTSWSLNRCAQHNVPKISADKPVVVPQILTKTHVKTQIAPRSAPLNKSSLMPSQLSNEASRMSPPANVACSVSVVPTRPQGCHLQPPFKHTHNGRDADESLRESSPGFDVLVDDESQDTNSFHVDGRGTSSHEVNNLDMVNDFDPHHSSIYNSMAQFERETPTAHNEVSEYDRCEQNDLYHQDDSRYSERIMERACIHGKRGLRREDCPNEIDGLDLRHRLLKKRKLNGLQSASNPDHNGEPCRKDDRFADEKTYRIRNPTRDQHHLLHESSRSNRLQGRITLPRRPPSDNPSSVHSEKHRERRKDWYRSSSPGEPLNYQGRLHDRITHRNHEELTAKMRKSEWGTRGRDEVDSLSFAGPKSLAELKGSRVSNDTQDRLSKVNIGAITHEKKNSRLNKALGHDESECSLSFEGPKPLSEILKGKREALASDATSRNGHENNQKVVEDHREKEEVVASITDRKELLHADQSSPKKETLVGEDGTSVDNTEDPEAGVYDQRGGEFEYEIAGNAGFEVDDSEGLSHPDQLSFKEEMLETEDGMLVDNMEDSEENYYERDGDFEYEAVDASDFRTYDENGPKDEDDVDDEDGDDFARKIGIMFS